MNLKFKEDCPYCPTFHRSKSATEPSLSQLFENNRFETSTHVCPSNSSSAWADDDDDLVINFCFSAEIYNDFYNGWLANDAIIRPRRKTFKNIYFFLNRKEHNGCVLYGSQRNLLTCLAQLRPTVFPTPVILRYCIPYIPHTTIRDTRAPVVNSHFSFFFFN